jgi:hypothetical protein
METTKQEKGQSLMQEINVFLLSYKLMTLLVKRCWVEEKNRFLQTKWSCVTVQCDPRHKNQIVQLSERKKMLLKKENTRWEKSRRKLGRDRKKSDSFNGGGDSPPETWQRSMREKKTRRELPSQQVWGKECWPFKKLNTKLLLALNQCSVLVICKK